MTFFALTGPAVAGTIQAEAIIKKQTLPIDIQESAMFKIVMTAAVIIVVLGWIAYGVWRAVTSYTEKKKPKQRSERLQQAKKSMDDYAKKMQDYDYREKPYRRQ